MRLITLLLLLLGLKSTFAEEKASVGFIMFLDCDHNQSYELRRHSNSPKTSEVKLMQELYEGDVISVKKTGCNMWLYVNEKDVQLNHKYHSSYEVEKTGKLPTLLYNVWSQVQNVLESLLTSNKSKPIPGGIRGEETDSNLTTTIPLLEGYGEGHGAKLVAGKRTLVLNLVGGQPQEIYLYPKNSNNKIPGKINGQQVRFEDINFVDEKTYWVEVTDNNTPKKLYFQFQVISNLPPLVSAGLNDSKIPLDHKKLLIALRLLQKDSLWGLEAYQQVVELKDTNTIATAIEKALRQW
jgi:hypothetical protein